MQQYLNLLRDIQENGTTKSDRTGTGTVSVFGRQMRFNLQEGFPLVTTKKIHLKSVIHELLWFLRGETNISYLKEHGVTIWDEWANEHGELGPVYGYQWRFWPKQNGEHIDQIQVMMDQLRNNPDSRRIIVSAWNVADLDKMALQPCHAFYQLNTRELSEDARVRLWFPLGNPGGLHQAFEDLDARFPGKTLHEQLDEEGVPRRGLSLMMYQRSCDTFLGVPFNVASYALLTHMIAQQANMVPEEFIWVGGDVHLYSNHPEQVAEQLSRTPRSLPTLVIKRKPLSIFEYEFEDFEFRGYDPHPAIKAPVAK